MGYSYCAIESKDGKQWLDRDAMRQDYLNRTIPRHKILHNLIAEIKNRCVWSRYISNKLCCNHSI